MKVSRKRSSSEARVLKKQKNFVDNQRLLVLLEEHLAGKEKLVKEKPGY